MDGRSGPGGLPAVVAPVRSLGWAVGRGAHLPRRACWRSAAGWSATPAGCLRPWPQRWGSGDGSADGGRRWRLGGAARPPPPAPPGGAERRRSERWPRLCHWLRGPVRSGAAGVGRSEQAGGQRFQQTSCSAFTATATACWRPWLPTGPTSSCRFRRRSSRCCVRSAASLVPSAERGFALGARGPGARAQGSRGPAVQGARAQGARGPGAQGPAAVRDLGERPGEIGACCA